MDDVRKTVGDSDWFVKDRFGLFIHWGLYAMAARHEWVQHQEQIPPSLYESKYFKRFDPDLYDPNLWAEAASNAGMKYFVITTKHHEGFCLWDSALTDYKAPNTPCKRDLLRPMVDAFRAQNMRVGFYHSLIDWHHPDYIIDPHIGPLRAGDRDALNVGREQMRYADYLHGQVRELLTQFGQVDILWLDFSYPNPDGSGKGHDDWRSAELYKQVRELMPNLIINDRLDLENEWDFKTPEQFVPRRGVMVNGQKVVWEACHTFSGSWGYHRDEASWKSLDQLVEMLIDNVAKGGNLLLNVGPTGRGEFDERVLTRLQGMGEWMKRHGRSIYGCGAAPEEFKCPQDCRLTYNAETNRLYVHLFAWPFELLHLDGMAGKVAYAQLLNDGSEVGMTDLPGHQAVYGDQGEGTLTLKLPVLKPNVTVPVVELFLK